MPLLVRLLLLLAVASLPALAVHVYNEYDLRQAREERVHAEVLRDAQALADELNRMIEGAHNVLTTLALSPPVSERDWAACNRFLSRLGDLYPAYSVIFVVDRDARITCASEPQQVGLELSDQTYARAMIERGAFVIGAFHVGRASSVPILPMIQPVRDDAGQIVAGAAVGLRLDWLSDHLAQKLVPAGNTYTVADRDGTILARSPDPEHWVGQKIAASTHRYLHADRPGSFDAVWLDGVQRISAYVPAALPPEGLFVVAGRDTEAALSLVSQAMLRGLAVSGAAGLLALFGFFLGGRYFLERPIRRLIAAADALRHGRYGEEALLPTDRSEFGRLGAAFKAMAGALAAREAALRDSEAEYRAIFEMAGRGKALADPATSRFLRVNRALCEMTGYSAEELCARTVQDITHPDDHEADRAARTRLVQGEDPVHEREKRYIRKDGTVIWVRVNVVLLRDPRGRPMHTVAVIEDITARKRDEERLKLLAAEVDHRAKNMLALVQVMLRQTRATTVQEYAEAAQGRVAALARSHAILSQSRWEGADLKRLVEEEVMPLRPAHGRVRFEGPPLALRPKAAQSLAMALHELATNAAKYGAFALPEGRVVIAWSLGPDGLTLRWIETGGSSVCPPSHEGLGLSVIKRVIREQLDGAVRIDWRSEGLVCEMNVPTAMVAAPGPQLAHAATRP